MLAVKNGDCYITNSDVPIRNTRFSNLKNVTVETSLSWDLVNVGTRWKIGRRTAHWAGCGNVRPYKNALLKNGDTKLNCGTQSAKYTSVIINFKFHAPYLLMQHLHQYSNYILKNTLWIPCMNEYTSMSMLM
jgi:hypothetical protein